METGGKTRLVWADQAKGFGIIAVVIGHTALEYGWWGTFIYSFHMPLFFFLSGFFFSWSPDLPAAEQIRKKVRTILVPYFVFAGLSYLYFLARYHFGTPSYYEDLDVWQVFAGIFYSAGTREWMDFNLPLWFLTCLFVTEMLFMAVRGLIRHKAALTAALAVFAIAGYLDGIYNPFKLPWGIDVALTAVAFFGAGYLSKEAVRRLLARPAAVRLALGLLFLVLNIAALTERMNVNMKVHGQFYDFYFAAFCGILWCLLLSSVIRSKALEYLGRHSLILMAVHMPMLGIAGRLVGLLPFSLPSDGAEALRAALVIVMALPVIYVIHRHFPWVIGKSRKGMLLRGKRMHENEVSSPSNPTII